MVRHVCDKDPIVLVSLSIVEIQMVYKSCVVVEVILVGFVM